MVRRAVLVMMTSTRNTGPCPMRPGSGSGPCRAVSVRVRSVMAAAAAAQACQCHRLSDSVNLKLLVSCCGTGSLRHSRVTLGRAVT